MGIKGPSPVLYPISGSAYVLSSNEWESDDNFALIFHITVNRS